MRIALVSRGVHPFGGGGIGVQVAGACLALREMGDVTVVTSSADEAAYRDLDRSRPGDLPAGVRFAFVDEPKPGEVGSYYSFMHLYSARVYAKLEELYADGELDLVEFPDFLGEGLVTVQGRSAGERFLRDTAVCVRLHTSAEMCSVLDGFVDDEFETRMMLAGERQALRYADWLLPPAREVHETYRRFYGDDALARASVIRPIVPPSGSAGTPNPPPTSNGLRILYMGRLERRKGVEDLIRAVTGLRRDNWTLTLLGGDTHTAPLGMSMREQLALATAEHPQVEFIDSLPRHEVAKLVQSHHLVVCPSRWECWPSVVLEAFEANRPVVVTPTGGLTEMVNETGAGWIADGRGDQPLTDVLEELLHEPARVDELIASRRPRRAFDRLNDPDVFRSRYAQLADRHGARSRNGHRAAASRGAGPLVSVVVPYYRLEGFIEETLQSIFAQDYRPLEVIVVNDGSVRPEDRVLLELSSRYPIRVLTKENAGLGRARNAGILQSRGRYVLPMDADNMIQPTFVSRCVEILERDSAVAFVTSWSLYIGEDGQPLDDARTGFQPLGNNSEAVLEDNVAGDATAVIRRRVFDLGHWYSPDLTSYEDWQFYRELHAAGQFGLVIPSRLLLYRVRSDSMLREVGLPLRGRLFGEMQAQLRERQIEWQFRSD